MIAEDDTNHPRRTDSDIHNLLRWRTESGFGFSSTRAQVPSDQERPPVRGLIRAQELRHKPIRIDAKGPNPPFVR